MVEKQMKLYEKGGTNGETEVEKSSVRVQNTELPLLVVKRE